MTKASEKGFALIELLVATSILTILLSSLYMAFQTGLAAYGRTEENLALRNEGEVFLLQLERELRNALPYFRPGLQNHFVGKKDFLSFSTQLRRYTAKGIKEELYLVRYEVKEGSLIRTQRRLRESFPKPEEEKETLLNQLETCRFDFLYVDRSNALQWKAEWLNQPYIGLPRGVRVTLSGDVFGKEKQTFEILIPHGVLLRQSP